MVIIEQRLRTDPLLIRTQRADFESDPIAGIFQDLDVQELPVKALRQGLDLLQILQAGQVASFELDLEPMSIECRGFDLGGC